MAAPFIFKVNVKYKDDAHPPQVIAVDRIAHIRTAKDAEQHCLKHLHHKDNDTFEIFPCVEAKAVQDEPFPVDQAPRVRSMQDAVREQ